jgi:hypothetical protein
MNAVRIVGYAIVLIGVAVFAVGMIITPHAPNIDANVAGHYTGHMSRFLVAATIAVLLGFLVATFGGRGRGNAA